MGYIEFGHAVLRILYNGKGRGNFAKSTTLQYSLSTLCIAHRHPLVSRVR